MSRMWVLQAEKTVKTAANNLPVGRDPRETEQKDGRDGKDGRLQLLSNPSLPLSHY